MPRRRRLMLAMSPRLAGAALLAVVLLGLFGWHRLEHRGPAVSQQPGTVAQVVDGDTIKVQGRGSVRILGIDAPETHNNSHGPKGCYGLTAKKRLSQIIPNGTPVVLVTEGNRTKDKYGRTLAYVEAGVVDVGEQMMREGMVDFYRDRAGVVVHFGRQAQYQRAWAEAEKAGVGLHNPACAP